MKRVARGGVFSLKHGVALLLISVVAAVGVWCLVPDRSDETPPGDRPDPATLNRNLLDALRNGDQDRVRQSLRQGANANIRDEAGDTALMRAALYADVPTMRLLLDNGADPQSRGRDGTAPLLRTTHDIEKMRLLLDQGAPVDDFVVVAAASVPGSRGVLELLIERGGRGGAAVPAFTALMAAAGNGDLDAVNFLLAHGADAKAKTPTGFTALIAASLSGNPEVVAALLQRGADPNAVCKLERGILQTPAGVASSLGHADCLRLLMAAGADVNVQGGPFNHNALLGAATTPSHETVRLLLGKADMKATDWNGNTALDWASRRGETDIVEALRRAAGEPVKLRSRPEPVVLQNRPTDADAVRRAVHAALPPLQESGRTITETRSCVSCHQHPQVAMAVGLARKRGFKVDEAIARAERAFVAKEMRNRLRPLLFGTGIDPTLAAQVLVGMAAEDEPPSRVTDALVHYLVLRQHTDGRWRQETHRPPDEASDFHFTAMAVRGLQAYAPPGRKREIAARIDLARRWLQSTEPTDTTDLAFQILGLKWAEGEPEAIRKAAEKLVAEQREDGGWGQLPTLASDAYATGLALVALHEGGVTVDRPVYRRGVEFLLRTQKDDGSWFVASRSFPIVEFSKSGFPHGKSQFISASATCWATMALSLTAPPSSPQ